MWRRCRPSVEKISPATKSQRKFASLMNHSPAPLLESCAALCSVTRCKRVLPNTRTHLDVETRPPHSQIIDQPGVDIDPQPGLVERNANHPILVHHPRRRHHISSPVSRARRQITWLGEIR